MLGVCALLHVHAHVHAPVLTVNFQDSNKVLIVYICLSWFFCQWCTCVFHWQDCNTAKNYQNIRYFVDWTMQVEVQGPSDQYVVNYSVEKIFLKIFYWWKRINSNDSCLNTWWLFYIHHFYIWWVRHWCLIKRLTSPCFGALLAQWSMYWTINLQITGKTHALAKLPLAFHPHLLVLFMYTVVNCSEETVVEIPYCILCSYRDTVLLKQ